MSLSGKVALVTGASRGIGRGIALQLGQAGAKVYITGRAPGSGTSSSSTNPELPSLEQTAEEITRRGGSVVCIYCDHSKTDEVKKLFARLEQENSSKLDILVNNAYSGVTAILENAGKKFYECEPELWDEINEVGLRNHYFCCVLGARLMNRRNEGGLIVNVSSAGGLQYVMNVPYGVGKAALDRMSSDMALELRPLKVAVVPLWPGVVKTENTLNAAKDADLLEAMGRAVGVKAQLIQQQVQEGETPEFVGKAVVGLATDPNIMRKSGKIQITTDLAREYKFADVNAVMPPNMRSVCSALTFFGWPALAQMFPEFIRIPKFALHFASYKF